MIRDTAHDGSPVAVSVPTEPKEVIVTETVLPMLLLRWMCHRGGRFPRTDQLRSAVGGHTSRRCGIVGLISPS